MVATLARTLAAGGMLAAMLCGQTLRVRLHSSSAKQGSTVSMDMEDYVAAALAGEAGGFTSTEALKAMAVTARTYARMNRGRHASRGYDYCDTTHCQDIHLRAVNDRVRQAVADTEGMVLWYDGRLARVFYHANCGGHTESAGVLWRESSRPYLKGTPDSSCANAGSSKWSATIAVEDLRMALALPQLTMLEVAQRSSSGRVTKLRWDGGLITAGRLHRAVGGELGWGRLQSSLYEVLVTGDKARFDGRGRGHGVGLCQIGAEQRGKAGQSYETILAAYFPGTRSGVTARGIAWQTARGERVDGEIGSAADEWVMAEAERAAGEAEKRAGQKFAARPKLRVYPTVAAFREATGEPGFVAASTRRRTIRLQPPGRLKAEGRLGSTLLHEMLHVLLGQAKTPLWFEEGMVERVAGNTCVPAKLASTTEAALTRPRSEAAMRSAYANACGAVAALEQKHGRAKLMEWLRNGLDRSVVVE